MNFAIILVFGIMIVLGVALIGGGVDALEMRHYNGRINLPTQEASDIVYCYGSNNFTSFSIEETTELIYDFDTKDKINKGLSYTKDGISGWMMVGLGIFLILTGPIFIAISLFEERKNE